MEHRKRRIITGLLTAAGILYLIMLFTIPLEKNSLVDLLFPSTGETYAQTMQLYRQNPPALVCILFLIDTLFVCTFYVGMALLVTKRMLKVFFLISGAADMVENLISLSTFYSSDILSFAPVITNLKFIALGLAAAGSLGALVFSSLSKHR